MSVFNLICSDVDGTLLNKDRELSEVTIVTISEVSKYIPFVFISSRMPKAILHLQRETSTEQMPYVAYNGGIIQCNHQTLLSVVIPFEITAKIVALNQVTGVHLSLYNANDWFVPEDDFWAKREASNTKIKPSLLTNDKVLERWKNEGKGAHKIMCMGDAHKIEILYQILSEQLGSYLHLYRSKPTYIEIAPKQISKFTAIEYLLEHQFDFTRKEVVAYGDNYNDIDLLTHVGLGVAVSNAKDEVKAIANQITHASYDNGVAISIRYLFKEYLLYATSKE